ncbi:protein of unknown function DUF201 [Alkaliphilus metalliredigens QYMF]|uniref:ATP-grasp domain-containing protein n=1 Tax=Alkaliphilus metalliredigens (strain QYMF) TaxID=293826 RepID=A6TPU7_ALKMQ|nr:ATP-grasp domain-containing protein [Alkaliphilus metalliredigens]ABR48215.1 protein of unknown function DUF201 [Alkaliphilus metalliredigens QYMF]
MAHLLIIEGWISDSGNLILPLLNKMGHTYTFVTRNPSLYKSADYEGEHPLFKNAENTIEVDTNNIKELILAVKDIKFDGVITACDYYFEAVRSVANEFGLPCPLPNNLKHIRQKHLMRQTLESSDIANVIFRLANSWEEIVAAARQIGYPLIIKPVDLDSSSFVRLIKNEEELKEAFDALEEFSVNYREQPRNSVVLLEEFLPGEEVSVESVSFEGKTTIIGITDKSLIGKPYFIETGHMFPANMDENKYEEITEYVKSVLDAVGFENGVAHTEVKLTKSGPRIIEINPRVPGNYIVELIEHVTGLNLLRIFVGLSLGEKPELSMTNTGIVSAASLFFIPPREGTISQIKGVESLKDNPNILRYHIPECSDRYVKQPIDNTCYLGHVIAQDTAGYSARQYGEQAIKQIELVYKK